MANLIKNQILKHLSKFTKNLNADSFQFSMLKGQGELASLELDENIMMELMDLPSWLRINKAVCNRITVKVQWTKLKSQPLCIFFDEVLVEVETCDTPRATATNDSHIPSYSSGGKYGMTDRVVDGICLTVNSVSVLFRSHAFQASLQLSRVILKSKTPNWRDAELQYTRLRHPTQGEMLLFKELEWMTTRIEANGMTNVQSINSTPLRLIANQSKIRIVIKKRLSDCAILASRVKLFLDDLLWVLTDSQLRAAILFARSLRDVIARSAERSKMEASNKVQMDLGQYYAQQGQYTTTQMQQQGQQQTTNAAQIFAQCDIIETSYHLNTGRVDLHLCGAMCAAPDQREADGMSTEYSKLFDSGAMQITLSNFTIDHYPFHPAGGSRTHWVKVNENTTSAHAWNRKLLSLFWDEVEKAEKLRDQSQTSPPGHGSQSTTPVTTPTRQRARPSCRTMKQKLLESCFIIRLEDFSFYRVSTAESDRRTPKKFLASDKKQLMLPREMSSLHFEYTDYYYSEGINYPVPHAAMYSQVNPISLTVDYLSILWLHSFAVKLFASVATSPTGEIDLTLEGMPLEHRDICFQALMPRIVLPAETIHADQPERPQAVQLQVSKVTVTNCHLPEEKSGMDALFSCLQEFQQGHLYHHTSFPNAETDLISLPTELLHFAVSDDKLLLCDAEARSPGAKFSFGTHALKRDAWSDVWFVGVEQVWAEFLNVPRAKGRPQSFVENFPLSLWYCFPKGLRSTKTLKEKSRTSSGSSLRKMKSMYSSDSGRSVDYVSRSFESLEPVESADINIMVQFHGKVQVQLNHYQYLFLMRLMDSVMKYQTELEKITEANLPKDCLKVKNSRSLLNFSLAFNVDEMELALLTVPIPEPQPTSSKSRVHVVRNSTDGVGIDDVDEEEVEDEDVSGRAVIDVKVLDEGSELTSPNSDQRSFINDSPTDELPKLAETFNGSGRRSVLDVPSISKSHSDSEIRSDVTVFLPPRLTPDHLPLTSPTSPVRQRNGASAKANDIRKSFNSALSGLDSVVKGISDNLKNQLQPEDEEWELCSEKSFISEDDESEFLAGFRDMHEMPAFGRVQQTTDTPDSSTTGDTDMDDGAVSAHGAADRPKQHLVSVFRIMYSECIVQTRGSDVSIKAQTQYVNARSFGNVTADVFQSTFVYEARQSPCEILPRREHFPIKLRFDLGPSAEDACTGGGGRGYLQARAADTCLQVPMSAVTGLTELIEDEVLNPGICMLVEANNVVLVLHEDRQPVYKNSATSAPLQLTVKNISVKRGEDGVFKVQAKSSNRDSMLSLNLSEPAGEMAAVDPNRRSPLLPGSGALSPDSPTSPHRALAGLASPAPTGTGTSVDSMDSLRGVGGGGKVTQETLLFQLLANKKPEKNIENWKMEVKRLQREKAKLQELTEHYEAFQEECREEGLTPLSLLDEFLKMRQENKILLQTIARQQDELNNVENEKKSLKAVIILLEDERRSSNPSHS